MDKRLHKKLDLLKEKGRYRALSVNKGVDLTSNDYLGLRGHPILRRVALEAIESGIDFGAGGSRLLRGHDETHETLENFAAEFFGAEKALYFATGYQANFAFFTTLPDRHDVILFDSFIHASARDGIQASHAKSLKVPHNDLDAYEKALKKVRDANADARIWVAVESIYSMDGDITPLRDLYDLARRYDAVLVVDEAHATGVFGEGGRGLAAKLIREVSHEHLVTVHTCGKALGVAGGLICGDEVLVDYMINTSRPFIYSTAPPPLQPLLVFAALKLVAGKEGEKRRENLRHISRVAHELFGGHGTHIVPIILGDDKKALGVSEELNAAGFDIRAIRPPTVPEGTSRLRLSLNADLKEQVLRDLAVHLDPHLEQRAA